MVTHVFESIKRFLFPKTAPTLEGGRRRRTSRRPFVLRAALENPDDLTAEDLPFEPSVAASALYSAYRADLLYKVPTATRGSAYALTPKGRQAALKAASVPDGSQAGLPL